MGGYILISIIFHHHRRQNLRIVNVRLSTLALVEVSGEITCENLVSWYLFEYVFHWNNGNRVNSELKFYWLEDTLSVSGKREIFMWEIHLISYTWTETKLHKDKSNSKSWTDTFARGAGQDISYHKQVNMIMEIVFYLSQHRSPAVQRSPRLIWIPWWLHSDSRNFTCGSFNINFIRKILTHNNKLIFSPLKQGFLFFFLSRKTIFYLPRIKICDKKTIKDDTLAIKTNI